MRIVICEDEAAYSDMLCNMISDYFESKNVKIDISVFADGDPFIKSYINENKYDVVFLDIQLENSDGMSIAAEIRKYDSSVPIIFVTGLENRAVEGYAVSAFDYIVKSSLKERLHTVLDRFMQSISKSFLSVQISKGDTAIIPFSNILWIESESRGSVIVTENEEFHLSLAIGKISDFLPPALFTEVYKSVFVNLTKIRSIGNDTVIMCNEKKLPLSRRKRKNVMSAVMSAVRGKI